MPPHNYQRSSRQVGTRSTPIVFGLGLGVTPTGNIDHSDAIIEPPGTNTGFDSQLDYYVLRDVAPAVPQEHHQGLPEVVPEALPPTNTLGSPPSIPFAWKSFLLSIFPKPDTNATSSVFLRSVHFITPENETDEPEVSLMNFVILEAGRNKQPVIVEISATGKEICVVPFVDDRSCDFEQSVGAVELKFTDPKVVDEMLQYMKKYEKSLRAVNGPAIRSFFEEKASSMKNCVAIGCDRVILNETGELESVRYSFNHLYGFRHHLAAEVMNRTQTVLTKDVVQFPKLPKPAAEDAATAAVDDYDDMDDVGVCAEPAPRTDKPCDDSEEEDDEIVLDQGVQSAMVKEMQAKAGARDGGLEGNSGEGEEEDKRPNFTDTSGFIKDFPINFPPRMVELMKNIPNLELSPAMEMNGVSFFLIDKSMASSSVHRGIRGFTVTDTDQHSRVINLQREIVKVVGAESIADGRRALNSSAVEYRYFATVSVAKDSGRSTQMHVDLMEDRHKELRGELSMYFDAVGSSIEPVVSDLENVVNHTTDSYHRLALLPVDFDANGSVRYSFPNVAIRLKDSNGSVVDVLPSYLLEQQKRFNEESDLNTPFRLTPPKNEDDNLGGNEKDAIIQLIEQLFFR
eukprot:GHVH01004262.1.p1 GENE.GHVH01004262.1~~GHVH01004262.1.p1  ORF type:complete len:636 (+),score=125.87 GHVH01004262.1:33-1910(+)